MVNEANVMNDAKDAKQSVQFDLNLAIALPLMDSLTAEMVGPVMSVCVEAARLFRKVTVVTTQNCAPHDRAREFLFNQANVANVDLLFFIDSDTLPPPSALSLLLIEMMKLEKAAVVSAHYLRRGFPFSSVWANDEAYVDAPPDSGPIEIKTTGLGCALVDMKFVRTLERPWFLIKSEVRDNEVHTVWEDAFFCAKVRAAGGKVWGVPKVHCGHLFTKQVICRESADALRKQHVEDQQRGHFK